MSEKWGVKHRGGKVFSLSNVCFCLLSCEILLFDLTSVISFDLSYSLFNFLFQEHSLMVSFSRQLSYLLVSPRMLLIRPFANLNEYLHFHRICGGKFIGVMTCLASISRCGLKKQVFRVNFYWEIRAPLSNDQHRPALFIFTHPNIVVCTRIFSCTDLHVHCTMTA